MPHAFLIELSKRKARPAPLAEVLALLTPRLEPTVRDFLTVSAERDTRYATLGNLLIDGPPSLQGQHLVLGCDADGNAYGVRADGASHTVYFVDHEEGRARAVAPSFAAFLEQDGVPRRRRG